MWSNLVGQWIGGFILRHIFSGQNSASGSGGMITAGKKIGGPNWNHNKSLGGSFSFELAVVWKGGSVYGYKK